MKYCGKKGKSGKKRTRTYFFIFFLIVVRLFFLIVVREIDRTGARTKLHVGSRFSLFVVREIDCTATQAEGGKKQPREAFWRQGRGGARMLHSQCSTPNAWRARL